MAKVLKVVAVVAGVIAFAATAIATAGISVGISAALLSTIGAVAGVVAGVASLGSQLLTKPPPARGSETQIQVGIEPPSPYLMGEVYSAGMLRHDTAYGATLNKVPNPYRGMVIVYSVAGPLAALLAAQTSFAAVPTYYDTFLYTSTQLGASPEPAALAPHFAGMPGWDTTSKLSGEAAILWNFLFDKDGKRFASGIPPIGAVWQGVRVYDPRLDSTYPGGAGTQRIADETTWTYSANPALHAIAYAYGRRQNGKKVFGIGQPVEGIDLARFVAWANICDANVWRLAGTIYEPGDRWTNLKEIMQAGCGEPVVTGGVLSVRYRAPQTSLATVTESDLADDDMTITAMQSYRDRINGIVPKYRSADHNWEFVSAAKVTVSTYVTEDGEEKTQEQQWNLVRDAKQAAQLAAYALVDARELGPINLVLKPQWRSYKPGECLTLNLPSAGFSGQAIILHREIDPATMKVKLTLIGETSSKHAYALGQTASPPPTPALGQTGQARDTLSAIATYPPQTAADLSYASGATIESLKPAAFGATAGATIGADVRFTDATIPTRAVLETSVGTAAAIAGQAATATSSDFSAITGATRPEAYASSDGNLVPNSLLTTDASQWYADPGVARVVGAVGDPVPAFFRKGTAVASNSLIPRNQALTPVTSSILFIDFVMRTNNLAGCLIQGYFDFRDSAGNPLAANRIVYSPNFYADTVNVWKRVSFQVTPPPGAAFYVYSLQPNNSGNAAYTTDIGAFYIGKTQRGADVTAANPKVLSSDLFATPGDNLIVNSLLLDGVNNWTGATGTGISRVAAPLSTDPASFFFRMLETYTGQLISRGTDMVPVGDAKKLFFYLKARVNQNFATAPLNVALQFWGADKTTNTGLVSGAYYGSANNTWADLFMSAAVPAGSAFVQPYFSPYTWAAGTTFDIAAPRLLTSEKNATVGATSGLNLYDSGLVLLTDAIIKTSLGTAAAIAGQGALATKATVTYGTADVTGFGTIAAQSSLAYSGAFLSGFGAMAARTKVSLGDGFTFRADGTTALSDASVVTSLGIAASITGQGALATSTDFANMTGTTKPAANADVTSANLPQVNGSTAWAINADYLGTITTSLPQSRQYTGMVGGTNVSGTTNWALGGGYDVLGLTVDNTANSATRGQVTEGLNQITASTTASTGNGTATLTATFTNGAVVTQTLTFTKVNAPAPVSGSAGATSASITALSIANSGLTSTSAVVSSEVIVRSDSAGKLKFAIDVFFTGSGLTNTGTARYEYFKIAYATTSGGALTDVFADTVPTATPDLYDANATAWQGLGESYLALTQYTMPAANTDYYFKLKGRTGTYTSKVDTVNVHIQQV